ncbi:TrmH family RNA methyltransferase [Xanthomonas vesicatoria]|uniref:TrmH family RNA methyltransferase n=1 Tax=Xanthomonas vesicatoria TaxID=56460 RepID=UPI0007323C3A|nr:TrmH family RNA methyltransferase [Xanthomonas vesicatoria]KTF38690.1 RNA methyltransferase [Xanthomonas vesicatoria]MCC8560021.1 RNA methyltransferase [Xanthomonas vesicatoria]MCC8603203.1 RNA methyltransferase [Xanthomonas vesicatoria]MCC8611650.1 RNA methyltransferase [Xanthomonas vesicatoria]MCC8675641.1 RNA methyltransferase [Xanthomonas vesicatoria]
MKQHDGRGARPPRDTSGSGATPLNPWGRAAPRAPAPAAPAARTAAAPAAANANTARELRLYGINAVQAVFKARPQALRKLYLTEARIPQFKALLAWCVAQRIGYRVVEDADLSKLAASTHHEGVVAEVLRVSPQPLQEWLAALPQGPVLALWLDGVGNPHNFGAILRSSAHFGVAGLLLPADSTLGLSGAAARVAEGGAEAVPLVQLPEAPLAMTQLRQAGFAVAATLVEGGQDVFAAALPQRLVYVMGAESEGMDRQFARDCDLQLSIHGSGLVESLNVASATAVFQAAWRARVNPGEL